MMRPPIRKRPAPPVARVRVNAIALKRVLFKWSMRMPALRDQCVYTYKEEAHTARLHKFETAPLSLESCTMFTRCLNRRAKAYRMAGCPDEWAIVTAVRDLISDYEREACKQ